MIYDLGMGGRPHISLDNTTGLLDFPAIKTGHSGLDELVEMAWTGLFDSTADMLNHAEGLLVLDAEEPDCSRGLLECSSSEEELIERITQ